jgi:hypothetical protein
VALIGALLTVVEVNSGFLSTLLPVQYRQYTIMLWPVIMLALREVTTAALADKTA